MPLSRYYVEGVSRALRRASQRLTLVVALAAHGAGHALVALVGSSLVWALASVAAGRSGGPVSLPALTGTAFGLLPAGSLDRQALLLAAAGLAVLVVKAASGAYATYVQVAVAGQVGNRLRLELLDALLALHRLRHPRHEDHGGEVGSTARSVVRLTDRVHDVELGLSHGFLGAARAVAQLVPLAIVLGLLSARAAWLALAALGLFGLVLGRWRSGFRSATSRAARDQERLLGAADEALRHAELWVSYGAEGKVRKHLARLGDAAARGWARLETRAAGLSGANEALAGLALVAAIAAARAGWLGSAAEGGRLLAFAITFFLAYRPLRELAEARNIMSRARAAYEELRGVIARAHTAETAARAWSPPHVPAPRLQVAPGAEPTERLLHAREAMRNAAEGDRAWSLDALELRGLRLARGGQAPITFRVDAGRIAVVVGPTGAGKTTLLRTLLGLDPGLGGVVTYGRFALIDAPAGPRARPFAWVPQDALLLADTLGANVALGVPDADVDVTAALEPLGAAHLVAALKDAPLGAGGRSVSGGERQLIALSRALATRQPVLLLDEPTSGLDAGAQRVVLDAIARLRGKRTVLLVTHRREPMAIADLVVTLPQGRREPAACPSALASAGGVGGREAPTA